MFHSHVHFVRAQVQHHVRLELRLERTRLRELCGFTHMFHPHVPFVRAQVQHHVCPELRLERTRLRELRDTSQHQIHTFATYVHRQ